MLDCSVLYDNSKMKFFSRILCWTTIDDEWSVLKSIKFKARAECVWALPKTSLRPATWIRFNSPKICTLDQNFSSTFTRNHAQSIYQSRNRANLILAYSHNIRIARKDFKSYYKHVFRSIKWYFVSFFYRNWKAEEEFFFSSWRVKSWSGSESLA